MWDLTSHCFLSLFLGQETAAVTAIAKLKKIDQWKDLSRTAEKWIRRGRELKKGWTEGNLREVKDRGGNCLKMRGK